MNSWMATPRSFGNPKQTMIYGKKYLIQLINENNGTLPVFVSHNRFPDVDRNDNPISVEMARIFKDLDNERKPENALLDLRKLARFAEELNIPYEASYSGSKGFHFFHMLRPWSYKVSPKLDSAIRSVQLWWCALGEYENGAYVKKLRCDDEHIYGDWRRLVRMPGSVYAKWIPERNEAKTNGRHCISMTREMIFDWNMDDIVEKAKEPFFLKPKRYDNALTLKQFIQEYDIKESVYFAEQSRIKLSFAEKSSGYDKVLQKQFSEPCLYNALISDNPPHTARFAITVYCKDVLKFTENQVFELMQNRMWADNHNKKTCKEQIDHIYRKDYHMAKQQHKRCVWYKSNGMCIGEGCKHYRKYD